MFSDSVMDKCLLFYQIEATRTKKEKKWRAQGPPTLPFIFSNSFVLPPAVAAAYCLQHLYSPLSFHILSLLSHIDQAYFSSLSFSTIAAGAVGQESPSSLSRCCVLTSNVTGPRSPNKVEVLPPPSHS